jgi:hypothetical protein
MSPRKTTDFGALFELLVEDLHMQVSASVERTLGDFNRRLARIERRLDALDPANATSENAGATRICSMCDKPAVARGLCSAHYQQWRYRERKNKLARELGVMPSDPLPELRLTPEPPDVVADN